jgi:hypothetical protein
LFQIVGEARSLDHQLMPPLLDLRIGKMNRENRGKCEAASSDRSQRQSMPRTRLNTAHTPPLKNPRQRIRFGRNNHVRSLHRAVQTSLPEPLSNYGRDGDRDGALIQINNVRTFIVFRKSKRQP